MYVLPYRSSYPDYQEGEPVPEGEGSEAEVPTDVLDSDGYELVLPSGNSINYMSFIMRKQAFCI